MLALQHLMIEPVQVMYVSRIALNKRTVHLRRASRGKVFANLLNTDKGWSSVLDY
jgi:hypothetical protein